MALHTSNTAAAAEAASLATLANAGSIVIYSLAEPSTPETAESGVLATFALANPAFTVTGDVLSLPAALSTTVSASGTAQSYRVLKSDGTTPLWDGAVATSGAELNLTTTSLTAGATLSISGFTYTVPGV